MLLIGFGRFGQIVSQCLLAEDIDVTTIDNDAEMIQAAARFGFKVYYGDGTRLDVLRAAGRRPGAADRGMRRQARDRRPHRRAGPGANFPARKLFVRSFDRGHTLELLAQGVDYQMRETFASASSSAA